MLMIKTYVLDTNVLIHEPYAMDAIKRMQGLKSQDNG